MSKAPAIRYARTDDGFDIAYWKLGRGPTLVHLPNVQLSHLLSEWTIDGVQRWYRALARSFAQVRLDHRGGGLSSRGKTVHSIDSLVRDLETIESAAATGVRDPFVLFGWTTGGLGAVSYSARHPERISHLILWSSFARNASHGLAPRMRALFAMAATDWVLFTESISQVPYATPQYQSVSSQALTKLNAPRRLPSVMSSPRAFSNTVVPIVESTLK